MRSPALSCIVLALPLLVTACGQQERGEPVAVQKLQEGFVTGFPKGTVGVVVKDEKSWQDKRRKLAIDRQPAPPIDFNRSTRAILGSKSKGNYELAVTRLTVNGDRATVDMSVTVPGDNCDKAIPKVAPYQVIAVPAAVTELRFTKPTSVRRVLRLDSRIEVASLSL